jgi:uncharacterized protein YdhG (YjbR/CyaY superfamily)
MTKSVKTVAGYLNALDSPSRKTLKHICRSVESAAVGAEKIINYGVPAYRYRGQLICYLAAFKNHCSFYTISHSIMKTFKKELMPYKTSGVTIRFPKDKPLPSSLIGILIKAKIKENEEKAAVKLSKSTASKKRK